MARRGLPATSGRRPPCNRLSFRSGKKNAAARDLPSLPPFWKELAFFPLRGPTVTCGLARSPARKQHTLPLRVGVPRPVARPTPYGRATGIANQGKKTGLQEPPHPRSDVMLQSPGSGAVFAGSSAALPRLRRRLAVACGGGWRPQHNDTSPTWGLRSPVFGLRPSPNPLPVGRGPLLDVFAPHA